MAMTADQVEAKRFGEAKHGLDADEVRSFQANVVQVLRAYEVELGKARQQVKALEQRAAELEEAEEAVKRTFLAAAHTKNEMIGEAEQEAARLTSEASAAAQAVREEAQRDAAGLRAEAQRLRDEAEAESSRLRAGAAADAEQALAGAATEAARVREEAAESARQARAAADAEIAEVRAAADSERRDLDQKLGRLRTAVSDLEGRLRLLATGALDEVLVLSDLIDLETTQLEDIGGLQVEPPAAVEPEAVPGGEASAEVGTAEAGPVIDADGRAAAVEEPEPAAEQPVEVAPEEPEPVAEQPVEAAVPAVEAEEAAPVAEEPLAEEPVAEPVAAAVVEELTIVEVDLVGAEAEDAVAEEPAPAVAAGLLSPGAERERPTSPYVPEQPAADDAAREEPEPGFYQRRLSGLRRRIEEAAEE